MLTRREPGEDDDPARGDRLALGVVHDDDVTVGVDGGAGSGRRDDETADVGQPRVGAGGRRALGVAITGKCDRHGRSHCCE